MSLRFGEDAVGALAVSQDCYEISPDGLLLEVYGSAGSLRWSVDRGGERLQAWCSNGTTLERASYAQTLQSGTERAFEGLLADIYAAIGGRAVPQKVGGRRCLTSPSIGTLRGSLVLTARPQGD